MGTKHYLKYIDKGNEEQVVTFPRKAGLLNSVSVCVCLLTCVQNPPPPQPHKPVKENTVAKRQR